MLRQGPRDAPGDAFIENDALQLCSWGRWAA
jgi:hypothetical protein